MNNSKERVFELVTTVDSKLHPEIYRTETVRICLARELTARVAMYKKTEEEKGYAARNAYFKVIRQWWDDELVYSGFLERVLRVMEARRLSHIPLSRGFTIERPPQEIKEAWNYNPDINEKYTKGFEKPFYFQAEAIAKKLETGADIELAVRKVVSEYQVQKAEAQLFLCGNRPSSRQLFRIRPYDIKIVTREAYSTNYEQEIELSRIIDHEPDITLGFENQVKSGLVWEVINESLS